VNFVTIAMTSVNVVGVEQRELIPIDRVPRGDQHY
jgi:hypothetical protein